MPIPLQQILSEVQTDINDLAGERIQQGEYLDMLQMVMNEIAENTRAWYGRYLVAPNPGFTNYDPNATYNQYDIVLDTVSGIYYRAWVGLPTSGIAPPNPLYWVAIDYPPNVVEIAESQGAYYTLRVLRQNDSGEWKECREYSYHAIQRKLTTQSPFAINNFNLTKFDFTIIMTDYTGRHNQFSLLFGESFDIGEQVIIDLVTDRPFNLIAWTNIGVTGNRTQSLVNDNSKIDPEIPDYLYRAVKFGMTKYAFEKLFYKGDDSLIKRLEVANVTYQTVLKQTQGYIKQMKDLTNSIQVQPINWLGD